MRKDKDDRTPYKLSSDTAFEVGQFVSGILGSGARINKDGYGEMNGLTLREFLEVPELRFNRIDVVSGELWNSIAFGLIKSVDTEKRIVELKLEDGERSGLHVNDICRGIFSNFGNGTQSSGTDECGFQQLYGFSTAYFTPTEIIENKAGVFRFRYALKSGTTMHPCASMKFAVYGNFIDSSRQASAYSTRTYKRYLNKVNTWVIDPDKNIYAQYGDLEGLVIGGMTMHGYGSFQSNSYFTGVQIQFTPEQKDELKGEDAYGVNLSNYEDVVTVDDEGNIIGGLTDLMNVVSAGRNVVAAGQNVVTEEYRLRTHVQAFKGSKELFYSPVFADGGYVLSLRAVGCTAMVASGVVVVTSITDMNNCYVDISVNCEGNALFQKTYTVKVVRNGRSPITADIDNEMASVACDQNGKVLLGLPVETKVSIWYGTQPLKIDKIDLSAPAGVTASGDASTGTVRVTGITDAAEDTLPIGIVVHATYAGDQYKKSLLFTVNKVKAGENAVIYQLQPSVNSVKVDEEGNYTDASVYCKVTVTDGKTVSELDGLPSGFSMKYSSDGGPESDYNYGSSISFAGKNKSVKFSLYKGGTLVDRETIPVVIDGRSVVVADLDNEMDGVSCDQNGKVVAGLPVQTVVRMYAGTERLALTSISLTTPTGVTASYVLSSGLVNVTAIADSAADVLPIAITVKATWGGTVYTRSLTFTVNKVKQGDSAVIYNLLPSATVVKRVIQVYIRRCRSTVFSGRQTERLTVPMCLRCPEDIR